MGVNKLAATIRANLDYFARNGEPLNWQAVGEAACMLPSVRFTVFDEGGGLFTVRARSGEDTARVSIIPGPIGSYNKKRLADRLKRAVDRRKFHYGQRLLAALEKQAAEGGTDHA